MEFKDYGAAQDYVRDNAHLFSASQRGQLISSCAPGFLAVMQYEIEQSKLIADKEPSQ